VVIDDRNFLIGGRKEISSFKIGREVMREV
jgi:hypothetical protein